MLAANPRITDDRASFRWGCRMGSADQLQWLAFEPDTVKSMTIAFDEAVLSLELADDADPFRYVIAKKIIEIARKGERDPARLCERAIKELRG
jgi:hypothetical protein